MLPQCGPQFAVYIALTKTLWAVTAASASRMNTYTQGPFAGRTIRTELEELQSPKMGRKYASADRRAVDPPGMVIVRYFEYMGHGLERELSDYSVVDTTGTLCAVALFKIDRHHLPYPNGQLQSTEIKGVHSPTTVLQEPPIYTEPETGIPIYESCDQTNDALYGSATENPTLVDYPGGKRWIFAFPDLSVKREGRFLFRYRVFDMTAQMQTILQTPNSTLVQAECFGGAFQIFSSKRSPPLPVSTPLTRLVANHNTRVHVRNEMRVKNSSKKRTWDGNPVDDEADE